MGENIRAATTTGASSATRCCCRCFLRGAQLSQPQPNSTSNGQDSQQILAAELGRQLGQLGSEMTRRNLDIQTTLEIRPGYRFNVMVTKDIILPP